MSEIIGGYFSSHVPAIGGAIVRGDQNQPYWKPFFDGFPAIRSWLDAKKPDVAIVFYNDHGLNFFLDKMPTFAVGAASEYRNADEGWGLPVYKPFRGHAELSWHIIDALVESDFDITMCHAELSWHIIDALVESDFDITMCRDMLVDHALSIPFELAWPKVDAWPVAIVPIAINTVQHPLPSAARCLALGRAVHAALRAWTGPERFVVIGSGGLSHQLDGARAGFVNPDYDRFCLDNLASDPDALTHDSIRQIVTLAGTQGVEILNWIAARGALGDRPMKEAARNYHIPISNTAAATMVIEPA